MPENANPDFLWRPCAVKTWPGFFEETGFSPHDALPSVAAGCYHRGMHTARPQLPALRARAIQDIISQWKQPAYRTRQILDWRNRGVLDPAAMLNLPAPLQEKLGQAIDCQPLTLRQRLISTDGTRKYVFSLASGKLLETVFIPEASRGTVCVSSQIGCVFDCAFCHTGTQAFEANLTAGEICAQVLAIKHDLRENPGSGYSVVTHVVYMGMGEPLANEKAVHESLDMLLARDGLGLSRRRITVSTSGIIPAIERLGAAFDVNLAVSLHAANNHLRDRLVPINSKYPLDALRRCLDAYPLGVQRHITLEYVLLDDINDRDADIRALVDFVHPARERINLISFNPFPGTEFRPTPAARVDAFATGLIQRGIRATVRKSRGQDIMAACGQLKATIQTEQEKTCESG